MAQARAALKGNWVFLVSATIIFIFPYPVYLFCNFKLQATSTIWFSGLAEKLMVLPKGILIFIGVKILFFMLTFFINPYIYVPMGITFFYTRYNSVFFLRNDALYYCG